MLGIFCKTVSRAGFARFAKSPAQEIAAHKQIVQKETGHYWFICKTDTFYDEGTKVVSQVTYKLYS